MLHVLVRRSCSLPGSHNDRLCDTEHRHAFIQLVKVSRSTPSCCVRYPLACTWRLCLVGIGFIMALFISGLAFASTHFKREAQLAILIGSLLAAATGIAILLSSKAAQTHTPN